VTPPAGSAGTDGDPTAPVGRHRAEDDPTRWVKPLGWIAALVGLAGATGGTVASAADTGDAFSVRSPDVEPSPHVTAAAGPLEIPTIGAVPEIVAEPTQPAQIVSKVPTVPNHTRMPATAAGRSAGQPAPRTAPSVPIVAAQTPPEVAAPQPTPVAPAPAQPVAVAVAEPAPTTTAAATTTGAPPPADPTQETPVPISTEIPLPTVVEVTAP
jgi:hypothetical protein